MTDRVMTSDGTHHGLPVNLLKARLLLAHLALLKPSERPMAASKRAYYDNMRAERRRQERRAEAERKARREAEAAAREKEEAARREEIRKKQQA